MIFIAVSTSSLDVEESRLTDTSSCFKIPFLADSTPWDTSSIIRVVKLSVIASAASAINKLITQSTNAITQIVRISLYWCTFRSTSVYSQIINISWITDLFASLNRWIKKFISLTSDTYSTDVESIRGTKAFFIGVGPNSSTSADRSTDFCGLIIWSTGRTWSAIAIIHSKRSDCTLTGTIIILLVDGRVTVYLRREWNAWKKQGNYENSHYWTSHIGFYYY